MLNSENTPPETLKNVMATTAAILSFGGELDARPFFSEVASDRAMPRKALSASSMLLAEKALLSTPSISELNI